MAEQRSPEEELREARATIERQRQEIASLQAANAGAQVAIELRRVLMEVGAASALSEPPSQENLLEMLIQTAAIATSAEAGSLLVLDASGHNLIFKAATGPKAAEVRQFVVPLGQGIAGFVAETGQPMAISNVTEDARFYRDIGQSLNYIPRSMLCVPIRHTDEIIGVIQLLDKDGGDAFTTRDMELVGSFVQQAATVIQQSRTMRDLSSLVLSALRRLAGNGAVNATLEREVAGFVRETTAGAAHGEALALAQTITEIGSEGQAELALARAWLEAFLQYLRSRNAPLFTLAAFQ